MQFGALIALLRGVTSPFLTPFPQFSSLSWQDDSGRGVAIRAPNCLIRTSEFLSLMNPLLTQMLGESASVEIQASVSSPPKTRKPAHPARHRRSPPVPF